MKAIVDCNSFYCSCERLFRPDLEHQPVVVLSNNDGCIISRSDEAKALGLAMGIPYFKVKDLIRQHQVACFSSNYALYGDLSSRVMQTLRELMGTDRVEVYSVDEAFIDLEGLQVTDYTELGQAIRNRVEAWTGIRVSVGIAATKVLSKMANRLAKKDKAGTACVVALDNPQKYTQALEQTPVAEIWGIGRRYADQLQHQYAVFTAYDLTCRREEWVRHNLGGITGVRLLHELQGKPSIEFQEPLTQKRMIATTRMFGQTVTELKDIKEAVATYVTRAAEKLRRQQSKAGAISVFVVPQMPRTEGRFRHGPSLSKSLVLPVATAATHELIQPALQLVDALYEPGMRYKKAGVTLSELSPDQALQTNLFNQASGYQHTRLMEAIDNINFSMRDTPIRFASTGTKQSWKMRQEMRSLRYTTRFEELPIVR